MSRLLPLLTLALIPFAVVAAPVPPGARTEFGNTGLVTRADLEKVPFDTRTVKREDGRDWPEEAVTREEKGEKREDKPRPANRYDLAVHMPWTKFTEGEPVPAYFVLRNNRGAVLGLGSRMDLSGGYPEFQGGGMSLDVRDRATGKSVLKGLAASTNCGGGSLVDVPADGFYCVRGDLTRIAHGLAPGEYEVDWRCGGFASAPTRFTITKADGAKLILPAKRTLSRFYHLTPDGDRECSFNSVHTARMASALAVGQNGAYVPDVHTIPAADKLVEASIQWKPYRDGDRLAVTLRAVAPNAKVQFAELPHLFLQLQTVVDAAHVEVDHQAADEKDSARDGERLVTPLTIEVRLPKGWREQITAREARVAVSVTSKTIEFPRGNQAQLLKANDVLVRADDKNPAVKAVPVWSGIVRTPFVELRFPPTLPAVGQKP